MVVGAGVAGLAAARALHDNGIETIVLEGRDRIGGRTHTVEVGSAAVDLGASWVHPGPEAITAPVLDHLGIGLLPAEEDDIAVATALFDLDTGFVGDELRSEVFATFLALDDGSGRLSGELGPRASMADALERVLDDRGLDGGDERRIVESVVRSFVESSESGAVGDVSLRHYANVPYLASGDDHLPAGGYRGLVDGLAAGVDIATATPVDEVAWTDAGVTVTAGNRTEEASHVVVAVPLGVLKADAIAFSPGLGSTKTAALRRLGFGVFEKVALEFAEPFWRDGGRTHLASTGTEPDWSLILDMGEWYDDAPVLIGLATGSAGAELVGRSPVDRVYELTNALEAMFGRDASDPVDTVTTDWADSPFTGGAYSYLNVASEGADDLGALAAPLGGRVLFAGEATSRTRWASVDGAWESGIPRGQAPAPAAGGPALRMISTHVRLGTAPNRPRPRGN